MKNKACLPARQGFTLIELLVVIAVIGLLATIVLFSVDVVRSKSRDSRRAVDIKSIQEGLSMYYNEYSFYPDSEGQIEIDGNDIMSQALIDNEIMSGVPIDPLNRESYKYYYESFSDQSDYELIFYLETNSILNRVHGENIIYP